jgi:DNA ligase-1
MDLKDGESTEMKGSGKKPYTLKNTGGVYSCSCPAWRNQSLPIEKRTCKHLRKLRGDEAEESRIGSAVPRSTAKEGEKKEGPPVLLAEVWEPSHNPTGWWISEKLDGVRAYWDGKQFISRLGNIFLAPDWFIKGLPNVILDGELWMGRKLFQKTNGFVRRHDKGDYWKDVKYVIFDMPGDGEFEQRIKNLHGLIHVHRPTYALIHGHEVCTGIDHLKKELARVEELGGEGLMIRQPKSLYEAGRSSTLLKVKSFVDDEGVVSGYTDGTGKYKGKVGALLLKWNDREVKVGTGLTDEDRSSPPPVGSLVNFRYLGLTDDGEPRHASYVGIRDEI